MMRWSRLLAELVAVNLHDVRALEAQMLQIAPQLVAFPARKTTEAMR
jgi:hypothetical protein